MKCPNCHQDIGLHEKFCSACGTEITVHPSSRDIQVELYKALIGPNNQSYYLERFLNYDKTGAVGLGWHWPAFFVTFYWFLYRKMWLNAFLYFISPFIFSFIIGFIFSFLGVEESNIIVFTQLILIVIIFFVLPSMANRLYYRHIQKKISRIQQQFRDTRQQLERAEKQGGTSSIVLILATIFGFIFVIGILAAIAIPAYQSYVQRAQFISFQEKVKQDQNYITEYYNTKQQFPERMDSVSTQKPFPQIIKGVMFNVSGDILVEVETSAHSGTGLVTYSPIIENHQIQGWSCHSEGVVKQILPANCRE